MSTEEASLGLATTRELIVELAARAEVATTIGEMWPGYSTVGGYAIEEQVKPAVEEPTEFGSIVRALGPYGKSMLWQKTPEKGKHYWESETGVVEVWPDLQDPEVLRGGVAESGDSYDYKQGVNDTVIQAVARLRTLRAEAITSERKSAYDCAISTVEELRP